MGGSLIARQRLEEGRSVGARGTEPALRRALELFTEAAVLAAEFDDAEARRTRALALMNAGSVERALGRFSPALATYEAASRLWEDGSSGAEPEWQNALGATLLNRGELLLLLERPEAVELTRQAIAVLQPLATSRWNAVTRNLAGAWLNLSRGLQIFGPERVETRLQHGAEALQCSLRLSLPAATTDLDAHLLTLLALRQGCDAVGEALPQLDAGSAEAWTKQTWIWVQQGIELSGATIASPQTSDLTRRLAYFGAQVLAAHAPHHLTAYLEMLTTLPACAQEPDFVRRTAEESLRAFFAAMARPRFWSVRDPESIQLLETARALRTWAGQKGLSLPESAPPNATRTAEA